MQLVSILFIAALAAGCSRGEVPAAEAPAAPGAAMQVVANAVRAIGGRKAVDAARTLLVEGAGEVSHLSQSRAPEVGPIAFRITGLRLSIDLVYGRWRQEQLLTPLFAVHYPDPQKEITALDGDVPFDVGEDGVPARSTDPDARVRRDQLRHSPLAILQAALRPGAAVSNHRRTAGRDVVDVRIPGEATFTLAVDAGTGRPVMIESKTDQVPLGDVLLKTEFADYRPAGDLMLPTRITSVLEGSMRTVVRVSTNTVNAPIGDLAAPAAVKAATAEPPAPQVSVEQLAGGVWLLGGETHHSALVEFADHLTLIEAPLSEARTLAVIARARQLRPNKPLTHLVVTHHHFDHSAGVRAAVSEGLAIIAHQKNRGFIESMVARPHAIAPDALARTPRPLTLQPVGERTVLRDAERTMELHAVDSQHAEGMLVAYLPRERLLIEVDLYTELGKGQPPPPRYPFAAALLDAVQSRHLEVERIVPLHRGIVPFADLVAAARKAPPP